MKTENKENVVENENVTIAEIETFKGEIIKISTRSYKDVPYVDVRVWFKKGVDDAYRPTKKGIFFRKEQVGELINALSQIQENS